MNHDKPPISSRAMAVPWLRIGIFYGLWVVLAGTGMAELWAGIPAAALSGWLSARLLPGGRRRWSAPAVALFFVRFVRCSVVAGVAVALAAFRPRMEFHPGYVDYPSRLPEGSLRNLFSGFNSLMPGTLGIEQGPEGGLQFHCLNVNQPVGEDLRDHEASLMNCYREGGGE